MNACLYTPRHANNRTTPTIIKNVYIVVFSNYLLQGDTALYTHSIAHTPPIFIVRSATRVVL